MIGEIVSTTAAKTAGPTVATVATTAVKPLQPLQVQAVEATATSPPAQNGCGQRVTYQAPLIVDGTPDTAWRVAGDGRGVKVTISLPQASKLEPRSGSCPATTRSTAARTPIVSCRCVALLVPGGPLPMAARSNRPSKTHVRCRLLRWTRSRRW